MAATAAVGEGARADREVIVLRDEDDE